MKRQVMILLCIAVVAVLGMPVQTGLMQSDMAGENTNMTEGKDVLSAPADEGDEGTEYWALMVAVGIYKNNPGMDRPSMLEEVARFQNMLPVSERWSRDHIKVITRENATVINIIKGFRWLDEHEDEDDVSLVYLTTHGFPILWDLPPFDEEDGMDEALATYKGFLPYENPWSWEPLANPFAIMTDDMFNVMFNRLESEGLGVIVDSCHSGGFNDNFSMSYSTSREVDMATEFAGELKGTNRIVVTSVPEEDTSYGSYFAHYLIEGMKGYADSNGDDMVSLEEAFYYAEDIIKRETRMDPQIFDDYPGELMLTEGKFPRIPAVSGDTTGTTNVSNSYTFSSADPNGDDVRYYVDWGDGTTEETDFYASGESVTLAHDWSREGTYEITARATDEHGLESDWSDVLDVSMAYPGHTIDQRQTVKYWMFPVNSTRWCAQSFVPSVDTLATVELNVMVWEPEREMTVSLRESLDGSNLTQASLRMKDQGWNTVWTTFALPNVFLTPGNTYYIVCSSPDEGSGTGWVVCNSNPYERGSFYTSSDGGQTWGQYDDYDLDGCFVTYG